MGTLSGMLLLSAFSALTLSLQLAAEEEGSTGQTEVEADTYWSGTAPLCLGGCNGKHRELRRDRCGDSSCCWVGHKSLCRVNCGKPDADFNAVVYGNDWWVGSIVRYSCRPGFMLVGDPSRICQSDGKWSLKPTCLRICQQGRLEINERDIDGNCSSTCSTKTYSGSLKRGCVKLENCQSKEPGWKRWFVPCDDCVCGCLAPFLHPAHAQGPSAQSQCKCISH